MLLNPKSECRYKLAPNFKFSSVLNGKQTRSTRSSQLLSISRYSDVGASITLFTRNLVLPQFSLVLVVKLMRRDAKRQTNYELKSHQRISLNLVKNLHYGEIWADSWLTIVLCSYFRVRSVTHAVLYCSLYCYDTHSVLKPSWTVG